MKNRHWEKQPKSKSVAVALGMLGCLAGAHAFNIPYENRFRLIPENMSEVIS